MCKYDVQRENLGFCFATSIILGINSKEDHHCKMSTNLGKRKRNIGKKTQEEARENSEESVSSELDAQEIFRRHFEARFKPLPAVKKAKPVVQLPEDDSEEDSVWDGISEDGQAKVEVVEHTDALSRMALMSKEELKVFMVWHLSTTHGLN